MKVYNVLLRYFVEIDKFQLQQKQKIQETMAKKRKATEELQRETIMISEANISSKHKQNPKLRED